jgi:hypothetical protein
MKGNRINWLVKRPHKINADNPKNVRRETMDSKHFWEKRWNIRKARLMNLKYPLRTGILELLLEA